MIAALYTICSDQRTRPLVLAFMCPSCYAAASRPVPSSAPYGFALRVLHPMPSSPLSCHLRSWSSLAVLSCAVITVHRNSMFLQHRNTRISPSRSSSSSTHTHSPNDRDLTHRLNNLTIGLQTISRFFSTSQLYCVSCFSAQSSSATGCFRRLPEVVIWIRSGSSLAWKAFSGGGIWSQARLLEK